jgi:hypothetical protein
MRSDGEWVVFRGWVAAAVLTAVAVPWVVGVICMLRWVAP